MGQEWSGWLALLARGSLGALLIAAAVSKWRAWDEFAQSLAPLRVAQGRPGRALARLLPWGEAALGGMLVAGIGTRLASAGTAALMAVLAALLAAAGDRPLALRCAPGLRCRAGGWAVARNLGLAAVALLPILGGPDALTIDHLLLGAPARALVAWEAIPATGLMLFAVAAAMLLPAVAELAGRPRRAAGA